MIKISKPPIGVLPNKFWLLFLENPQKPSNDEIEQRITDLKSAIERYQNSSYTPPDRWQFEIEYLINRT